MNLKNHEINKRKVIEELADSIIEEKGEQYGKDIELLKTCESFKFYIEKKMNFTNAYELMENSKLVSIFLITSKQSLFVFSVTQEHKL